jgi:hypothetical protein
MCGFETCTSFTDTVKNLGTSHSGGLGNGMNKFIWVQYLLISSQKFCRSTDPTASSSYPPELANRPHPQWYGPIQSMQKNLSKSEAIYDNSQCPNPLAIGSYHHHSKCSVLNITHFQLSLMYLHQCGPPHDSEPTEQEDGKTVQRQPALRGTRFMSSHSCTWYLLLLCFRCQHSAYFGIRHY